MLSSQGQLTRPDLMRRPTEWYNGPPYPWSCFLWFWLTTIKGKTFWAKEAVSKVTFWCKCLILLWIDHALRVSYPEGRQFVTGKMLRFQRASQILKSKSK